MEEVDAILFDFDGTIVDSYDLILECFHYTVREVLGEDYADEVGPAACRANGGLYARYGVA